MPNPPSIRSYTPADLETLAALRLQRSPSPVDAAALARWLAQPNIDAGRDCMLAFNDDGSPAGFACLIREPAIGRGVLEVNGSNQHRGGGAGDALLREVYERGRTAGLDVLQVDVAESEEARREAFAKRGWVHVRTHLHLRREGTGRANVPVPDGMTLRLAGPRRRPRGDGRAEHGVHRQLGLRSQHAGGDRLPHLRAAGAASGPRRAARGGWGAGRLLLVPPGGRGRAGHRRHGGRAAGATGTGLGPGGDRCGHGTRCSNSARRASKSRSTARTRPPSGSTRASASRSTGARSGTNSSSRATLTRRYAATSPRRRGGLAGRPQGTPLHQATTPVHASKALTRRYAATSPRGRGGQTPRSLGEGVSRPLSSSTASWLPSPPGRGAGGEGQDTSRARKP